jgi:hypothetical protein
MKRWVLKRGTLRFASHLVGVTLPHAAPRRVLRGHARRHAQQRAQLEPPARRVAQAGETVGREACEGGSIG